MSAGRARRRRLTRNIRTATWSDSEAQPARYVGSPAPGWEAWCAGPAMFVIPALPDGAPPEVLNALDRRRRATLTGRCDCGARRRLDHLSPTPRAVIHHADTCPAADPALADLLAAWREERPT